MTSPWRKYATVAAMGWQDSLVYRFNAMVWVLYAVVPAVTMMLVWLAAYSPHSGALESASAPRTIGGYSGSGMLTYYFFVTALSVIITPNPEWDIAAAIRDGKITPFVLRPIGYFGYRLVWETSYQVVKTAMLLGPLLLVLWCFRGTVHLEPLSLPQCGAFVLACLGAFLLLMQMKFLVGISAFWVAEPGGFMEVGNVVTGLLAGRLLPLTLLPLFLRQAANWLPFSILYSFPMQILLHRAGWPEVETGFAHQSLWLVILGLAVHVCWRRGLAAYETYGG